MGTDPSATRVAGAASGSAGLGSRAGPPDPPPGGAHPAKGTTMPRDACPVPPPPSRPQHPRPHHEATAGPPRPRRHGCSCDPRDKSPAGPPRPGRSHAAPALPPSPTSVHPSETSPQSLPFQTTYQHHAHAPYAAARAAIYAALSTSPEQQHRTWASKLARCCADPVIYLEASGHPTLHAARCRTRLCPLCSNARARQSTTRIEHLVRRFDAARFLTLTTPATDAPLADQLTALGKALAKLRSQPRWKSHVSGGLCTIEVTFNHETSRWHPHLHLLIDGTYYPQKEAESDWTHALRSTPGPWKNHHHPRTVVDIRATHGTRAAARYVAKYIAKPADFANMSAAGLRDLGDAFNHRRTLITFGTAHARTLDQDDHEPPPPRRTRLLSIALLSAAIEAAHPNALHLALLLAAVHPVSRHWLPPPAHPSPWKLPSDPLEVPAQLAFHAAELERTWLHFIRERHAATRRGFATSLSPTPAADRRNSTHTNPVTTLRFDSPTLTPTAQ